VYKERWSWPAGGGGGVQLVQQDTRVRAYYISVHEQVRVFIPVTVVVYYLYYLFYPYI
jgi:hypothetical protein